MLNRTQRVRQAVWRTTADAVFISSVTALFLVLATATVFIKRDIDRPVACLWAFACFSLGALVGFLFGIPRAVQDDGIVISPTSPRQGVTAPPQSLRRLRTNTNLERISDWLTTIIVGVGLVQIGRVPSQVMKVARYASNGVGENSEPFMASLIILFSVMGFLHGYLTTRTWLAILLTRAEGVGNTVDDQSDPP